MTRLSVLCVAVALACASGQVLAATASHNAAAEKFLTLTHAHNQGTAVYIQVQQMFDQRFAETKAPPSKKSVLDSYQAKANAALDNAIGWRKLRPQMVDLYTATFTESELHELVKFYESPLGKKVLREMPKVTQLSAKLTQQSLEPAVPVVNKLLEDMTKQLDPNAGKAASPERN
ncbi:DUF2059 domain-containing protein [Myxococcus sp. CA033]|uniref:DUF2059 domain-containing protein n=1 Tax=Myxococcus sp. CA033 TaxID=2741516 RepID=UPI00157B7FA2|nr:DUF2059 domain-containing protein [Myxococcus sp. CA033]NTX41662.1 DUF2059 domain-containing protein [Myxococcus sp. CA033]